MAETVDEKHQPSLSAGVFLRLLRVRDWVKNLVILLPLFFSGRMGEGALMTQGLIAVAAFCCVSSAIYIFNDLSDRELDRLHPRKRARPIASGAVRTVTALALAAVLLAAGMAIAALLGAGLILPLAVYLLLNVAYSLGLKYIPVMDITILALGYVIRIVTGGAVIHVTLSAWIVALTFLSAMFIGMAKRREDVVICLEAGIEVRRAIEAYNLKFVDAALSILASVTIVAYLMFTFSPGVIARFHTDKLYWTTVFVIAGILHYLRLILAGNQGGNPTDILFTDRWMQLILFGWIVSFGLLIYAFR
jgi:decaprenyl-phosphate phosphoribosyltransferase